MAELHGCTMLTWVWLGLMVVAGLGEAQKEGGFLPVPVWKFMNVSDSADSLDLGRPQFSCGDVWLSVRLRLIRHSNLSLEDGRKLPSLPDKCGASSQTFGSWLLLKFPYTDCPVESLVLNGTNFYQLKLRYFDHLPQDHVTAEASCRDPATQQRLAAPLVRCTASDVIVKLPPGGSLQRVEALGEDGVVGTAIATNTTADAVLIQIFRTPDTDSFLEITLLDSAGELCTVVSVCVNGTVRDGQPRSAKPSHTSNSDDGDSSETDEEEDSSEADSEADDGEDSSEEEDSSEAEDDDDDDDDDDDEDSSEVEEKADDSEDSSEEEDSSEADDDDDDEDASDSEEDGGDEDASDSEEDDDGDASDSEEDDDGDASDSEEDDDGDDASDSEDDDGKDSSEADEEEDEDDDSSVSKAGQHAGSSGSAANNTASPGLAAN